MTIDPARLLATVLPEVRQRVTPRDVALYALSVGLGQDPTDPRQLRYVDPDAGLTALPSMATVMAHAGPWLHRPETGIDALRLVHGEQEVEWLRPLPLDGTVAGRTRVAGLVDRGAGRGSLLYIETELSDGAGTAFAALRSTVVLRGDGGYGGPAGPVRPPASAPTGTPDAALDLPTRPEQALVYRLNGDRNPIHSDPAAAAAAGFPRPILHGLCTFGVVCHGLVRAFCDYDASRLRAMRLRFTAPVFPGETLRVEMWRDGAFRARAVERDVVVVDNGFADVADGSG